MAKLYFRYGAMNSGKSTGLLQTAYNYEERDQRVLLLKAVVDTRGEDSVVSRLGVSRRVDLLVDTDDDLRALVHQRALSGARLARDEGGALREAVPLREVLDCVLVDEAQFLTALQVDQLMEIALVDDVPVLAYWPTGSALTSAQSAFPGHAGCWRSPTPWRSSRPSAAADARPSSMPARWGSPSSSTAIRWPSTPGTSRTSRCVASATSLPVGGFPAGESCSGTELVSAGVQG